MMRSLLLLAAVSSFVAVVQVASTVPKSFPVQVFDSASEPTNDSELFRYEGNIEIESHGYSGHLVWLNLEGSNRELLVSYRAQDFWRPFNGERVSAVGYHYRKVGAAINASHFKCSP